MVLQAKFDTYRHLGIQEAFALPPASTPLAVGELAVQAMRAVAQAPGGTAWGKLAAIGAAGVAAAG